MIIQSADQYNVPPLLLAAVIRQESSYNSNARSPTGAVGLTQIIPSYWQQTCAGNLYDETSNIQCGAYILNHYYQSADSWFKATAYYNVGPTGYERSFWTRHKSNKKSPSINGLFYIVNFIRQINLQIKQKINIVPRYQEE
jgi:soluble lytic murein transglycosylase-like protein